MCLVEKLALFSCLDGKLSKKGSVGNKQACDQAVIKILPDFQEIFQLLTSPETTRRVTLCSVMSSSLWPHGLQHTRLLCSSPSPRVCSNSCPLSWYCHPTTSPFIIPFSSCSQSFPASGSFWMSWLFISGGQCLGTSASASVLPMNSQGWFPLGLTGLILLFKGLSRVFSSTAIWKHQFFGAKHHNSKASFLWVTLSIPNSLAPSCVGGRKLSSGRSL